MVLTVKDVMTPKVVSIEHEESVKNAARRMTKFGISSLIVFSKDGLKGILTEKDIVQRVVCTGLDPTEVKVCEVMSEPVIVVNPEEALEKAVEIMLLQRIKKLPVMETKGERSRLVGILSLLDVAQLHPDLVQGIRTLVKEQEAIEPDFYIS